MITIKKCTRCGECCIENPCFLSRQLLINSGNCSALEKDGGQYSCGLYLKPTKYLDLGEHAAWKDKLFSEIIKNLMGIGKICEKNSPRELVKSIFGDIPDELVEFLLWEKTALPTVQTAQLRDQLVDALIEGNIRKSMEECDENNPKNP